MGGRGPDPLPRVLAVVGAAGRRRARAAGPAGAGLVASWPTRSRCSGPGSCSARVLLLAADRGAAPAAARGCAAAGGRGGADDETEPEGEPFPWALRGLGAAARARRARPGLVHRQLARPGRDRAAATRRAGSTTTGSSRARPTRLDTGSTWQILLLIGTVLLVVAIGSRWLAARRAAVEADVDPDDEQRAEVERLVAAVDAADVELRGSADPREAVLAAYAAMARQLSQGLARRGRGPRPSDTAGELLDHAVGAGLVSGAPAHTLTELFREARFSQHPIGEQARTHRPGVPRRGAQRADGPPWLTCWTSRTTSVVASRALRVGLGAARRSRWPSASARSVPPGCSCRCRWSRWPAAVGGAVPGAGRAGAAPPAPARAAGRQRAVPLLPPGRRGAVLGRGVAAALRPGDPAAAGPAAGHPARRPAPASTSRPTRTRPAGWSATTSGTGSTRTARCPGRASRRASTRPP